jgi:hypothetical protein
VEYTSTILPQPASLEKVEWEEERIVGEGVRRTLRYSTNRFMNATKCSAFRMLPGIASWIRSSLNTVYTQPNSRKPFEEFISI